MTNTSVETTLPIATTEINLFALKTKYDALQMRCENLDEILDAAFAAMDKGTLNQQKDLLLAVSDLQLLRVLFETAESTWVGINLSAIEPDNNEDDFVKTLNALGKEQVEMTVDQLGVAEEAVMSSMVIYLGRQVELIECIICRAEQSIGI